MSERDDLRDAAGHGAIGGVAAFDRGAYGVGSSEIEPDAVGYPLSPISRLTRNFLMIAVFFSGWAVLRIGEINLTLSDVFLALVILVMLSRGEINKKPFGNLTAFWLIGLGLMLLGLLVSTIVNGSVERWLIVSAQYLFALLLVPMLLAGQPVSLTRILPPIFVFGIVISQLIGISAMALFENADTRDLLGDGFLTGNGRLGAMTGEPNPNGAMVAMALPMLIHSVRQGTIPLAIGVVCGLLLAWGLLSSGSFTGFVAATAALAVYLAISGLKPLVYTFAIGAMATGLFLASGLPLPEAFDARVVGALSTGNLDSAGTFTGRSRLIAEAWAMADDNIFIGLGVDQFREVSIYGAPVHHLHLLIWNEGGIIAFVGLFILLLTMLAIAFVTISKRRPEGAMILSVIVVFNVYTFSIPHMYSRLWILPVLLAICTCFARNASKGSYANEMADQR